MREQYEWRLKDLWEAYGEAVLEICIQEGSHAGWERPGADALVPAEHERCGHCRSMTTLCQWLVRGVERCTASRPNAWPRQKQKWFGRSSK